MSRPSLGAAALVALVAALLIPIVGGWQLMRARDATLAETEQSARTLSHSLAQHAARTIEGVDLVLWGIVERVQGNADKPGLKGYLERRAKSLRQSHVLAVFDAQGMEVADSEAQHGPVTVADRAYFAWERDHADPGLHIDSIVVSRVFNQPTIPLSRRIVSKDGAFDGVAVASLMPADFQQFYDSLEIGPHGAVALWTETGRVLVRRPEMPPAFVGRDYSMSDLVAAFKDRPSGLLTVTSPIDGLKRIVAFESLENYPLVVSVGISTEDALGRWRAESAIQFIALALASAALVVLAGVLERHGRAKARGLAETQQADMRYRLLAQNSSDLIVLRPRSNTPWFYVSPSSKEMLGWSPEELMTLTPERYVHPEDVDRLNREFASLSPERPRLTGQYWLRHKDGRGVRVEAIFQMTDFDSLGACVIVTARDVTARYRAEEGLKDSEARYRLLADRSSDMVSRLDLTGTRLYVSPAAFEILGYGSEQLVGTRHWAFIHPEEAAKVEGILDRMSKGNLEQARSTHRVRHALGHWVWVETLFRLVRDPTSGVAVEIVSSLRDITIRQALQDQVQAGADLLKVTLESMEQGLIVVSVDRTIKISNRRAADLLAMEPEVTGSTPSPGAEARSLDQARFDWLFGPAGAMSDGRGEYQIPDGPYVEIRRVAMPDGGALLTLSDITHLKRAEMEARAANRLLMMAEEVAHVGHWRLDVKSGRRIWSEGIFRIHGVPVQAVPPAQDEAIARYHPDDRDLIRRNLSEAVRRRENFEGHYRIVRDGGELRHVLTRGRCEIDPETGEVNGLFGVIMDVTELTRTQRELGETTAHLRATLDNMDQGLIKVAPDGTIELSNRRFAELLDLPATLLEGPAPQFKDVVRHLAAHGDDVPSRYHLGPQNGSRILGDYERERPNGQILEIRTIPLPGGSVVRTYADITSRRRAEDAVRSSEAKYRMLADSTSDVITQLDLDFRRVYVSPASRAVFGYAPDEMLGSRPTHFIHPDDAAAVRTFAESIVAGAFPDDRATMTYRFRHKEGHWIWIEAGLNLVREPTTGAPASMICSLRDVSERQRVSRHLERAKAAAETAARVKTEFLANMSHELRTPLTGILGIHDLLHNDQTLGRQQRRYLGLARDAGRSLLSIVNDVLDFTKMEAGQFSLEAVPFELGALIRSCGDLVQGDARRKSLRVETSTFEAPLYLIGDPTRLRQILLNLLTNAIKFTERGFVAIATSYDRETKTLRIGVSDTGIGLPGETLPLLFERFSQADASITRRYGGTGLGLAICKRLVVLMGGVIGVDSNLGAGSVFWFEVPLRESVGEDRQPGAVQSAAFPPRRRVLLAEDNDINQDIISAMLEQRGHAVTVVSDGAAAVAAVRAGPRFAIILMDLQMPVMDGLSATRAIRAEESQAGEDPVPIVGLTANAMAEDVVRCRDAGMDAHVAKPIEWSDLFGTIERLTKAGPDLDLDGRSDERPEIDVLDEATLEALAGYIGRERLQEMLGAFAREVEARVSGFDAATPTEIAGRAHALVSLAGQLGFIELSRLCAEVETAARDGIDPIPIGEVRSAADRAVRAAQRSRYGRAA